MKDYNEYFNGYNVPENVKTRAINIMKRFVITGVCDGMYIANAIAMENGSGNGSGEFTEATITEIEKIASFLIHAYGCNIMESDMDDLRDILRDGEISKARMVQGLKKYICYCDETKKARKHDEWYIEYLDKCVRSARELIYSFVNSMCVNCVKFGSTCAGTNNRVWTGCIFREV